MILRRKKDPGSIDVVSIPLPPPFVACLMNSSGQNLLNQVLSVSSRVLIGSQIPNVTYPVHSLSDYPCSSV